MAVTYSTVISSATVPDGADNITTKTITLRVLFDSTPMLKGVEVFSPKYLPRPGSPSKVVTPPGYSCFSSIAKQDIAGTHYGVYGPDYSNGQSTQTGLIAGIYGARGTGPYSGLYIYDRSFVSSASINGANGLDYSYTQFRIEFDPYMAVIVDSLFMTIAADSGYIDIAIPLPTAFKNEITTAGLTPPTHAVITVQIGMVYSITGSPYGYLHFANYDSTAPGTGWLTVKAPYEIAAGSIAFCKGADIYSVSPRARNVDYRSKCCVNSRATITVPYFTYVQYDGGTGYYGDITEDVYWYDAHGNLLSITTVTLAGTFLGTASARPFNSQDISVYSGTVAITPPTGAAWFIAPISVSGLESHQGWCDKPTITIDGDWLPGVCPKIN